MGLKAFHLLFIACATLLAGGLSAWALFAGFAAIGGLAFIVALGLAGYLPWFWRKLRGWRLGAVAVALGSASASDALACSVCIGDKSSPLVLGANAAIMLLLVITATVLGSFGLTAFRWSTRCQSTSGPKR